MMVEGTILITIFILIIPPLLCVTDCKSAGFIVHSSICYLVWPARCFNIQIHTILPVWRFHCRDKMVSWPCNLCNGNSHTWADGLYIETGPWSCYSKVSYHHLCVLVQERRNSIANTLELRLSCINPSICKLALAKAKHKSDFVLGSQSQQTTCMSMG